MYIYLYILIVTKVASKVKAIFQFAVLPYFIIRAKYRKFQLIFNFKAKKKKKTFCCCCFNSTILYVFQYIQRNVISVVFQYFKPVLFYIICMYCCRSDEMENIVNDLERANQVRNWFFFFHLRL